MPELPEVETVKSFVERRILGKKIIKTKVLNSKLRWPIDTRRINNIAGKTISKVTRRGKYILVELGSSVLIIHLGMTGVVSFKKTNEYKKQKHDHLLIYFDNFILVYNDVRKFGSIHITGDLKSMFLLKHLGPEPISKEFNSGYLYDISIKRVCSVKDLIMNQRVVVGIGNIYATESLFLSKIHPATAANLITKSQYKKLVTNIKKVLEKSIVMGGSTIRDFINADGKPGYFSQKLSVYQRKFCPCHKKNLISNMKISGRSSFFCSKCQIQL